MTERNMYGCTPCPQCGGKYRYPHKVEDSFVITCGDCRYQQPADSPEALETSDEVPTATQD